MIRIRVAAIALMLIGAIPGRGDDISVGASGAIRMAMTNRLRSTLRAEDRPKDRDLRDLQSLVYRLDDAAVPLLMDALTDPNEVVQRNAMLASHGLRRPSTAVISAYLRLNSSGRVFEDAGLSNSLRIFRARFPKATGDVIASVLGERDWFNASGYLGTYFDNDKFPELTPAVIGLASRTDVSDWRLAAETLRWVPPSPDAHAVARQLLRSTDTDVQRLTVWSMAHWDTDLDPYFDVVVKQLRDAKNPLRWASYTALGRMKDHRAARTALVKDALRREDVTDRLAVLSVLKSDPAMASDCLSVVIQTSGRLDSLHPLFVIRYLDRLDDRSSESLQRWLDSGFDRVDLQTVIEIIRKFDPKLTEWRPRIVRRLERPASAHPDLFLHCLAKAPKPDDHGVEVVARYLKHTDLTARCAALDCLFRWGVRSDECVAMLKAQAADRNPEPGQCYFLESLTPHLHRPGVAEAVAQLCDRPDEVVVRTALEQLCRFVSKRGKPVPALPEIRVEQTPRIRMYRAWLGSAGKKPRGADARGLMHELLDDSDVWVRRDAVELLLLSDRTLWPQVNDIRRIIAIEDDDETRERLEKLLASDRPGR